MFVHLCLAVKLRQCDKHQKCTCLRCASVTAAALSTHPHVFHFCFGDASQLSLSPPFLPRPGLSWVLIVNLKMEKQGYNLETSKVGGIPQLTILPFLIPWFLVYSWKYLQSQSSSFFLHSSINSNSS